MPVCVLYTMESQKISILLLNTLNYTGTMFYPNLTIIIRSFRFWFLVIILYFSVCVPLLVFVNTNACRNETLRFVDIWDKF